jgi:hypothetical protein
MKKFVTVTAVVALALGSSLGLAACSGTSSSTSSASSQTVIGPTTVLLNALNGSTQDLKVGDVLYINTGTTTGDENWTATISNPSVLSFTPGTSPTSAAAGTAPTFKALAAGTTTVKMSNKSTGATTNFTVNVK